MSDIPSTEVIRHWCAWGYTGDDEAGMEHSPERVAQFEAWLAEVKADIWDEGFSAQVWSEQSRNPYRQGENK